MQLRHFDSSDRSPLNSVPLEQLQDTNSSSTIAPHLSSSYPEYLSPTWDKETQRVVVWTRLQEHCKLARQGLAEIGERYKALRQEQSTRVESRHESSSRDTPPVDTPPGQICTELDMWTWGISVHPLSSSAFRYHTYEDPSPFTVKGVR